MKGAPRPRPRFIPGHRAQLPFCRLRTPFAPRAKYWCPEALRGCLETRLPACFQVRHRPAPPPGHPRQYPGMGGRVGVRAGAGLSKRTLRVRLETWFSAFPITRRSRLDHSKWRKTNVLASGHQGTRIQFAAFRGVSKRTLRASGHLDLVLGRGACQACERAFRARYWLRT